MWMGAEIEKAVRIKRRAKQPGDVRTLVISAASYAGASPDPLLPRGRPVAEQDQRGVHPEPLMEEMLY